LSKVAFITLGCKLNQLETEEMADAFRRAGNEAVKTEENPDLIVINTCTVTSKAEQKARRLIRLALKNNPGARLIVTGCAAASIKEYFRGKNEPERDRISFYTKGEVSPALQPPTASSAAPSAGDTPATPPYAPASSHRAAQPRRFPSATPPESPGESTITGWLSEENLKKAGENKDKIFKIFSSELKALSYIHPGYLKYFEKDLTDNNIYSGQAYFIDHAVNHHPEVPISAYIKIHEILNCPDDVRYEEKRNSLIFIKKYEKTGIVTVGISEKNKKIVLHRTFFFSTKKEYKKGIRIFLENAPLVDNHPTVKPAEKAVAVDFPALSSVFNSNIILSCAERVNTLQPLPESLRARRLLKIQDGCNNGCTFCAARLVRGKSISIAAEKILLTLKTMEEQGVNEAVLTGLNIAQYSSDGARTLPALLDFLLTNTERIALRLSSLEPEPDWQEDFPRIAGNGRIRPHFHLSIQSASRKILRKMGRNYTTEELFEIITKLRESKDFPPFMACDIITGFPGETEKDFKETLDFCKKADFSWIHCFPYSPRPGTPAAKFPDRVPERVAVERCGIITGLAREGRRAYIKSLAGREVDAIVELPGELAISENYLRLKLIPAGKTKAAPHGALVRCRIGEPDDSRPVKYAPLKPDATGRILNAPSL